MGKLYLEKDDGTVVMVNDSVPDTLNVWDIMFRTDYVATKIWSDEDILDVLQNKGYVGTDERIAAVVNTGCLEALSECTDADWQIIDYAIEEAARRDPEMFVKDMSLDDVDISEWLER